MAVTVQFELLTIERLEPRCVFEQIIIGPGRKQSQTHLCERWDDTGVLKASARCMALRKPLGPPMRWRSGMMMSSAMQLPHL